jgi:hypothetical protein
VATKYRRKYHKNGVHYKVCKVKRLETTPLDPLSDSETDLARDASNPKPKGAYRLIQLPNLQT